jgi:hypothetical protein
MKRLALVSLVVALGVVFASAAEAKEPTAALIQGPGLSRPLAIGWPDDGSTGSIPVYGNKAAEAKVMALAERGGFFPAVFGQSPDPMLKTQPAGPLGPHYTIVFGLPGPGGGSRIVQDVYPYATPGPVTYMKAGQVFWDGQQTYGGWFVGTVDLKQALVSAGLSETPPGHGGGWSWAKTTLVSIGAAMALAVILLLVRRRLRSSPTRHPQAI